jgi:AcrR family transcriptional regulator
VAETAPKRRKRSPRVKRKYAQARQEILAVAERVLLDGGVDAVTLASVSSELGMTKQAIYHYFPSKEALVRSLVTALLENEIEVLIAAIEKADSGAETPAVLIRAFYEHYVGRLDAFRFIYCQSQLYSAAGSMLDETTLHDEINPRTRHLFDVLEDHMAGSLADTAERKRMRRVAFTAWLSALGLLTMLSVADATNDPLVHSDADLLQTLATVFAGNDSG